jgi:transcription elongation factor SPT5
MDLIENAENVDVRPIPRIDSNSREASFPRFSYQKQKKSTTATGTTRPPQQVFNFDEILKVYSKSITRTGQVYVFEADASWDGFLEKSSKVSGLILNDINPTLDEITQFAQQDDVGKAHICESFCYC